MSKESNDQDARTSLAGPAPAQQWLTLKDASDFLGVHYTTLRTWADNGEIRVFRTPGGHRRFGMADLRRFLQERVHQAVAADETALVDAAVGLARQEIQNASHEHVLWRYALDDDASNLRRQRGRRLFALAISFVFKATQRARLIEEGRKLGWDYGREAAQSRVSLAATGRAVRFFRNQLIQAIHSEDNPDVLDADDMRIQHLLDQFLDEVLYAVLDGYEQNFGAQNVEQHDIDGAATSIEPPSASASPLACDPHT